MSRKLYPPKIEGSIPAFYGNKIKIPFIMNKTVGQSEVGGFILLIKTAHSNKTLGYLETKNQLGQVPNWNFTQGIVNFDLDTDSSPSNLKSQLKIGSYYKVQLAYFYSDLETIGYYSTVGVIKYTSRPEVSVSNLDFLKINMNDNFYVGTYSQENKDITEKVYNYRFDIFDENGNLHETSGNLLHNSFEDENAYSSRDIFSPKKDILINKVYHLQYTVITTNGLEVSSDKYRIMQKETLDPEIKAEVIATLDKENGYINVGLKGTLDQYGVEYASTGSFLIRRACSKDNYNEWNTVLQFRLNGQRPSRWKWKDFTIEQGYSYKYALQQYNDYGLYSNRLESNEILASFEDAFLYDGKRQLKIKYNPKISSFKTNILQSKVDTIGSKYPFIFRNGNVSYKEFPISGLISYHTDEQFLFIDKDKILVDQPETNLTDKNIASERIFKQEVLDWLNNGETKLFRSPTEGNFIVKLLNVSLSPNDTVGRMLHTFNCTAYEVSEHNYTTLLDQGFIEIVELDNYAMRWESVSIPIIDNNGKITPRAAGSELLNHSPVYSLRIENVAPGTQFQLNNDPDMVIAVGITGSYEIDLGLGMIITSVKTKTNNIYDGQIVYSYRSNVSNVFDMIKNIEIEDVPIRQFVGETDIFKEVNNVKTDLIQFNFLHFQKRNVFTIYREKDNSNSYYLDKELKNKISEDFYEPSYIYLVIVMGKQTNEDYYKEKERYYVDGNPSNKIENYSNKFIINDSEIDLTETENYLVKSPPTDIKSFTIGSGLTLECSYQVRVKSYKYEDINIVQGIEVPVDEKIYNAKNSYEQAYNLYRDLLFYGPDDVKNDPYIDLIDDTNIDNVNYFETLEESNETETDDNKILYYNKNYFDTLKERYDSLYGKTETDDNKTFYNKYEYYLKQIEDRIKEETKYE